MDIQLIKIKPDSIEGFFNLGMTNYKLDLLDEAIGNFGWKKKEILLQKIYFQKNLNQE